MTGCVFSDAEDRPRLPSCICGEMMRMDGRTEAGSFFRRF